MVPKVVTPRIFQQGITSIIALKSTLELLPKLYFCLNEFIKKVECSSLLLCSMVSRYFEHDVLLQRRLSKLCDGSSLNQSEFRDIAKSIDRIIDKR